MANNLDQINDILYVLQRDFGVTVTYVQDGTEATNLRTGVITKATVTTTLYRVVVLESKDINKFLNIPDRQAGFFSTAQRGFIIWKKRITFTPSLNDNIRYDSKVYQIQEIHEVAGNKSFLLVAQAKLGAS